MEPPADALVRLERLMQGLPMPLLRDMLLDSEWVYLSRGQEVLRVGQYV
jgi:hypothetical protein